MQQLDYLSKDLSLTSTEFGVNTPYLADHGFLGMVVVPGSYFIEIALNMSKSLSQKKPRVVRNMVFERPVILSGEDTFIRVEARDLGENRVEYKFYEIESERKSDSDHSYSARLEIEDNCSDLTKVQTESFSIEAFQAQARQLMDQHCFYATLRKNGNQYGPNFQNVSSIWLADNQSLGKLTVANRYRKPHVVHSTLLDSITQLLATFIMEKGKPFVLRSIEKVDILDTSFPDTLWAHATLLPKPGTDGKNFVGNVRAFDQSGKTYLECTGVVFTLLENTESPDEERPATLAIASNFTAEPIEDSLKFWCDYFNFQVRLEFAPYNQLFQQLLDSGSAFHKNHDGINIILLRLEEWSKAHKRVTTALGKEKAEQCFKNHTRYLLPNGQEIVHLNKYETEYLYKEIFEDECYLKNGIHLEDGDTVVDIGANIGLFSLFVMSHCSSPRILAFEPAPVVYELLKANCEAYGSNVRVVNAGVSDQSRTAQFTFYDKSSVFSGFHTNETEDRRAIEGIVRRILKSQTSIENEDLDEYVNELVSDRLSRQTYECQLRSVSDIIRENDLEKINLLKIDAEKSELEIINGIEEDDWPKISQIVIEIHDPTLEVVKRIEVLLTQRGFHCAIEQESLLEDSGLFNLYASRTAIEGRTQLHSSLQRNVEAFCDALRAFMNEMSRPLILCICPPGPATFSDPQLREGLLDAEHRLISDAHKIANVQTISSALPMRLYPITDYYDPHSRLLGDIPYTSECYTAMGTVLARAILSQNQTPFKVIVLDCDNTLWNGVCAEVGPLGVEVTPRHRELQEFMVDQMKAGKLICLCSKNNESDVLAVLDQRTDMTLKREHLVSWRINWRNKSENIQSLANELKLGLDSFIFIDDNPVDCADVRINAPDVLTLQMPNDRRPICSFLNHVWAFDCTSATGEDRNRTRLYQENVQREQFHRQTYSLSEYIKGLQLRVEISEATDDQLERISQLTFRTNQFNFTTIRRHENEIKDFLAGHEATCEVVHVDDRFGDYGLVGVLIYEKKTDRYNVDTFLLSCRALGRGIEHAVLAHLGRQALRDNRDFVELTCLPTEKNLPAREFIASVGNDFGNEAGASWTFDAKYLARLQYEPDNQTQNGQRTAGSSPATLTHHRAERFLIADRSERFQRIVDSLWDIDLLSRAIEEFRLRHESLPTNGHFEGATGLQTALITIWRKALGRRRIQVHDNFFEVGGTSLKAVQVVAMIKRELKRDLSIVNMFEYPTIALLAGKLTGGSEQSQSGSNVAALRGQTRRTHVMSRRGPLG